jgi:PAS domain S-box-containing protein
MVLIKEISTKIKNILNKNPQGMTIIQIADKTGINRNTVGRYLENLLVSGQVEMHRFGMKKIYSLSQRVALSSILSISSELIVQMDSSLRIIYANEPFLNLVGSDNNSLIGKNIEYTPVSMVFDELFEGFIEYIKKGVAGKEWSGEFVLSTKNIHLFCRIVPTVFDDGRKGVSVILEDITEQKVSEAALYASEKRFQSLVEMLPQSIWECDDQGNVTFVNRRTFEMYGYEYEDVEKGMTIWQTIHPDDRERVLGDFIRASKEEPSEFPEFHEFMSIRKDGSTFPLITYHVPIVHENKITGMRGIGIDISERKRAEDALRESEEKYRYLVETTGTGYVILDKAGRVITANQEYIRLTGRSTLTEVEGRSVTDWTASYDVARNIREIETCFTKGRVQGFEVGYQKPDGTIQPIEVNASVIQSGSGPIILTLCRDITERKRAEEALRESEEKYRSFIERANDGVVIVQDGIIKLCNRIITEFWGGGIEQILGKNFTDFIHPDSLPEVVNRYKQRMAGESLTPLYETTLFRKDGSRFFAELNAGIIAYDGKPADLIIIRDINERKKTETALQESEEKYRTLVIRANDAICVLQDGVIKMFNPRLPEFWGGSAEEIMGRPFTDFVHPDALPDLINNYNRRMSGESFPSIYETTMMRKDGSRSFVEINAGVVEYEGRPADLVIVRDINDRKMAQEALSRSEALYRTLSEASNDLIFVVGRNDRVEYVNSYAAAMVNKSINQIIGSPRSTLFPPDVAINQKRALETVFERGISVRSSSPLTFNGRMYWYDHILTPLKDPDNHVRSILGISRDITERKIAEAALLQAEEQSRNIITAIGDIAWETDAESRFIYVSPQVDTILGYTPDELIGRTPFDFLHPDAVMVNKNTFQAAVESKQKSVLHVSHWIHKDGHDVLLESNAIPKYDRNGSFLGFIGIDRKR